MDAFDVTSDSGVSMGDPIQQQFEQNYPMGVTETVFHSASYSGGYSEMHFGNDPLSHAQHYNCPAFPGVHWVDPYLRSDGVYVKGYWRSNPDFTTMNNLERI